MLDVLQAVVLGVVQGVTEFLPVSSSGHLVLGQKLMGLREPALLFDVALHVGTLVAVLAVFWEDVWAMIRGLWARDARGAQGRRMLMLVIAATLPTALIGFACKDYFETMFASTNAVGAALLITGCLLMSTRLAPAPKRGLEQTGPGRAVLIGLAQGLAITPGISRSGTTISIALLLGVQRDLAARFSFLLSIPAILGALVLQLPKLNSGAHAAPAPLLAGALCAAVTGYLALRLLLGLVRKGRLHWFAYYCWALGLAALLWW